MALWLVAFVLQHSLHAQTLNLPPRPANAPSGTEFVNLITPLSLTVRENTIFAQIASGNVPTFLRTLVPVTSSTVINGTTHTVTCYVTPDYFAIGSDADYFLEPMTPLLAQRVANLLNCSLPTRKLVNTIWTNAVVKLAPSPISPSAAMTTVPVFAQHNSTVLGQRNAVTNSHPLGALVGGDKKDVVISTKIYTNFSGPLKPVVIYGWHQLNGSPIQPLYNGHEETYADYSHGIRMVQMSVTLDGAPQTITNILTNPNLAAVLSDEGVISIPRYTVSQGSLVITTQPYSRTVSAGTNVGLTVVVSGTLPISYQWQRNGSNVAGATSSALSLTNVQPAHAGSYTVVISNGDGVTTSIPANLNVNTAVYPVLFADDFETNSSGNWNPSWGAANNIADYAIDWAYNYGTNIYSFNGVSYLIPPAPNSGSTTKGVRLTVNNGDTSAATIGLNIYPKNKSFTGNFALKFDMWINYPGATGGSGTGVAGSTEHAIFGINHSGTEVNWAATSPPATNGLWFGVDGEGGTLRDYRAYVGNSSGVQLELIGFAASGLTESNNAVGIYPALFSASRFETAGAPGKQWVSVEVRQVNGIITWLLDGTVVAQRTNTSTFTAGDVMLGYMDTFPSIANPAKDAFVLFDNVRVEDLSGAALQPPAITSAPQSQLVSSGTDVTLMILATGSVPLSYQWSFNSLAISGATNSSLALPSVQAASAGEYSVVVSNSAGTASASATLTLTSSGVQFGPIVPSGNGQVQFSLLGLPGNSYVIEASTNLVSWRPITVLAGSDAPLPFLDPEATNYNRRFYRARQASNQVLTDFESFTLGTPALFQKPSFSGSTSNLLNLVTPTFAYVTNNFPPGNSSAQVLQASWEFLAGAVNPWLRFTTFNATNLPNPTISTNQVFEFDIYAERAVYVAVAFRETSTSAAIGADGGTVGGIEWLGGSTVNTSPPQGRFVPAGQWMTLQFILPLEPIRAFTGNGILQTTTGKGVFEHLCIVPADGSGVYNLYLDNFQVTDLGP